MSTRQFPWNDAPIIPAAYLPAIAWSGQAVHSLQVVGDELFWLTGDDLAALWTVRLGAGERAVPMRLCTIPPEFPARMLPDGEIEPCANAVVRSSLVIDDRCAYVARGGSVFRVARTGGPIEHVVATAATDEEHSITGMARVSDGLLVVGAFSRGNESGVYISLVRDRECSVIWREASDDIVIPEIKIVSVGDSAWIIHSSCRSNAMQRRKLLYHRGSIADCGRYDSCDLLASGGLLFATTIDEERNHDMLVLVDPVRCEPAQVLLPCLHSLVSAVATIGEWVYVSLWRVDLREPCGTLMRIRTDGRESALVLHAQGEFHELGSDGGALYWTNSGCVGSFPVDDRGATVDLAESLAITKLGALPTIRERETTTANRSEPPRRGDANDTRIVLDSLTACVVGRPASADYQVRPMPWVSWLLLALLRHWALQRSAIDEVEQVTFQLGKGVLRGSWRYVANASCVTLSRDDCRVSLRAQRHAGQLVVDPDEVHTFDLAHDIHARRSQCRLAARVWRWLPSRPLIQKLAVEFANHLGAVAARESCIRLPPVLGMRAMHVALSTLDVDFEEELARLAYWCGDHECIAPDDSISIAELRHQHRSFLSSLADRGEHEAIDALTAVFTGSELTEVSDRMLSALLRRRMPYEIGRMARVLLVDPDAPPPQTLRRIAAEVSPGDTAAFEQSVPYLCARGVDLDRVRRNLRMIAGLDLLAPVKRDTPCSTDVMLCALLHEPEAARALVADALTHTTRLGVQRGVALLVAVGTAWAAEALRQAAARAAHPDLLQAGLRRFGLVQPGATSHVERDLDDEINDCRRKLSELVGSDLALLDLSSSQSLN